MRHVNFKFIDENFGEEIEYILVWDDEKFILIYNVNEELTVKEYKKINELLEEFLKNKNELDFLRNLTKQQEIEMESLEKKLKKS